MFYKLIFIHLRRHKKKKLFCAIDATTLNDGNLYAVKGATVYPGYDAEKIINDIAILHVCTKFK